MQILRSWNSRLERVGNALIPETIHPNHLTYLRFSAIPALIILNYCGAHFTWMFVVVLVALLMDFLDGATARKRNQVTHLGIVLDPMTDKFLALTVLAILCHRGIVHWTLILWMVLAETHIWIVAVLKSRRTYPGKAGDPSTAWLDRANPNIYGKLKVIFYSISFPLLFLGPAIESERMVLWGRFLAYVGVIFGAVALVAYVVYWSKEEG